MMKTLRSKMIWTVFLSAVAVFGLTLVLIGVALQMVTQNHLDGMTDLIAKNGGEFPAKSQYDVLDDTERLFMFNFTEELPYRMRYFSVFFHEDGNVTVSVDHIAAVDAAHATQMAIEVDHMGTDTGYYGDFRYRVADDCVVFVDASYEMDNIRFVLRITALVAILFVILITGVFAVFSNRVVKPFEDNAKAQRQFITDASHELKTPVAIIAANAEVLSYKQGENEWLSNISAQTERMSKLVDELLDLSRLEEMEENSDLSQVNLSEMVTKAVGDFAEVFDKKNVNVSTDIEENIILNGNVQQLQRLVSVLVENASKYVSESGSVEVSLSRSARFATLRVFNSCRIDPDIDYTHLFDRFYRPDSSRTSEKGGHGIGLSIARRITELHGGTIAAHPSDEGMMFVATISSRLKAEKN